MNTELRITDEDLAKFADEYLTHKSDKNGKIYKLPHKVSYDVVKRLMKGEHPYRISRWERFKNSFKMFFMTLFGKKVKITVTITDHNMKQEEKMLWLDTEKLKKLAHRKKLYE